MNGPCGVDKLQTFVGFFPCFLMAKAIGKYLFVYWDFGLHLLETVTEWLILFSAFSFLNSL